MCTRSITIVGFTPGADQMVGKMLDDETLLERDGKTARVILGERVFAGEVYDSEMIALARKLCEANSDHPEFYMRYMPMVQKIKWGMLNLT